MVTYYKLISKCLENINKFKYKSKTINNTEYINIFIKNSIKHINCYVKKFICVLFKSNILLRYLFFFPVFIVIVYNYILLKINENNKEIKDVVHVVLKQTKKKIFVHVNLINAWKKWYYIDIQLSKIINIIKKKLTSTHNYITLIPLYKINFFREK
ncbi:hypothetical protein MACJ_004171 (apicoplast) [Theileria orientalis]|uniref:Uncharacterized protein n=1 Tax=Theileria orientalis TaxID=68886 RepID=A0A976SK41_THEOR|nr:hypothetical protein MACJ_004171 [Theileria orientalis]